MYIKIDLKILIAFVWFYVTKQVENYILLMIFVILHECIHMLVGIVLKIKPMYIEIKPIGCNIAFQYSIDDYNKKILNGSIVDLKKIAVYVAGPAFNLIIAFLCFIFKQKCEIISLLMYINLMIGTFNLICIYPLDGGRILKSLLQIFLGERKSYTIIHKISNICFVTFIVVCSFLILIIHNWGIILSVIYLWFIKISADKKIKIRIKTIDLIKKK